ncbi:MAG: hypothetical protein QF833_01310 [Alphaproteobacteria bacterium]|nr:hypothetical protein [Alphaproteobacteria bacterium]
MLLRASFFLMAFAFISGCAHYTLMEPGTYSLDDVFSVETDTQWSSSKYANGEMWTKNGISLERIFFVEGIYDGTPLFAPAGMPSPVTGQPRPPFRKDMNIVEIGELLTGSLEADQWYNVKITTLDAKKIPSLSGGFKIQFEMANTDGLLFKGDAYGGMENERLYMLIFLAPKLYYYPTYVRHFEDIVASAKKLN